MDKFRESSLYQEIQLEGRIQEILLSIELILKIQFGDESLNLMPIISQVNDLEKLRMIQQSIVTANNLDELNEMILQITNTGKLGNC